MRREVLLLEEMVDAAMQVVDTAELDLPGYVQQLRDVLAKRRLSQ